MNTVGTIYVKVLVCRLYVRKLNVLFLEGSSLLRLKCKVFFSTLYDAALQGTLTPCIKVSTPSSQ